MKAVTPVRLTAMHRAQLAAGARFREAAGWLVADVYTSAEGEVERARAGVGLHDASTSGKLGVRGADVELLVAKLTGRSAPLVSTAARERVDGTPVLVCRLAADELLLLTPAADLGALGPAVAKGAESVGCAHPTDLTSSFAAVELMGPRVTDLLERLVPLDLPAVPPLGIVQAEIARVHAILLRLDQPGLRAFRILVSREYGEFVWETLCDAGADLGLALVGAAARERLGTESGERPLEA